MLNPIFDATGTPLEIGNFVFTQDRSEDQDGDDLVTTSFGSITATNHNGTVDIKVTQQMCRFIGQHTAPLKRECKSHIITRPSETVIFRNYAAPVSSC